MLLHEASGTGVDLSKAGKFGMRILVHSRVPEGKGVSSSAALEVSTMKALVSALDVNMDGRLMAILCQKVALSTCTCS